MLARGITHVENGSEVGRRLAEALVVQDSSIPVIGVTGPPGAGKSTIVDRLIRSYRDAGLTVGVVAVDPSSPFSHGAILGDRIRMLQSTSDEGVYIRSMATRGHLGGLNSVIFEVLNLYRAFGFDRVLVETVGAGQSEIDVMKYCQTTVVVSVPGLGDGIQMLKAGILEIADVFVVNKADLPGAEQIRSQITNLLHLSAEEREWTPPVVAVSALQGTGQEELLRSLDRHHEYLMSSGRGVEKLVVQISETILQEVVQRYEQSLRSEALGLARQVLGGSITLGESLVRLEEVGRGG